MVPGSHKSEIRTREILLLCHVRISPARLFGATSPQGLTCLLGGEGSPADLANCNHFSQVSEAHAWCVCTCRRCSSHELPEFRSDTRQTASICGCIMLEVPCTGTSIWALHPWCGRAGHYGNTALQLQSGLQSNIGKWLGSLKASTAVSSCSPKQLQMNECDAIPFPMRPLDRGFSWSQSLLSRCDHAHLCRDRFMSSATDLRLA